MMAATRYITPVHDLHDFSELQGRCTSIRMGFLQALSVASLALASTAKAAVSSTGFTVSLEGVDYFLPPKPAAVISECEEVKALFEDAPFVPITVVKDGSVDVASFSEDDVWQQAFMEGR